MADEPRQFGSIEEASRTLEVGDIVLMHKHKGMFSQLVRLASRGAYWNHAAMVFSVVGVDGMREVILIEAQTFGIEVHRLDRYMRDKKMYVLGFKRLPGLTPLQKERIRGFFLDAVDTPYDYVTAFGWMLKQPIVKLLGMHVKDFLERVVIDPSLFVCTSFAQRAYYLALPPNERDRAFFIPDDKQTRGLNFLFRMVDIAPIDIAKSKNTVWLWGERY